MMDKKLLKILCVFGQHQYGDPSRGIGTEYAAFVPALKNLGHEVIHFDSWNSRLYKDYGDLNRKLLEMVRAEQPGLMLTVQMNYEIWLETLESIHKTDVATISWTTDDSWKYREVSRFIGPFYDAMTTTYPHILPKYHRDGINNVLLTQWAAVSGNMQPPLPARQCRFPVSFIGAAHGNREKRIKALQNQGIAVECFGFGWPNGSVPAERIPQIMRNSQVSLNFSNSKQGRQLKARTFEVPGAGGFLLTEYAENLEKFYDIGREIDIFNTDKELGKKIRYYLDHPEERDAMASAGFKKTKKNHTYEQRLKQVIAFGYEAKQKRMEKRKGTGFKPDQDAGIREALKRHQMNTPLKMLRIMLETPCRMVWGKHRGPRAARRMIFEASWRLFKQQTFSASGLPGRMFPEQ